MKRVRLKCSRISSAPHEIQPQVKGLNSSVVYPCVKILTHAEITLRLFEPDDFWRCQFGICINRKERL